MSRFNPEVVIFSHPIGSAALFGSTTVMRKVYNHSSLSYDIERMGGYGSFTASVSGEGIEKGDCIAVFNGVTCEYYGHILSLARDEELNFQIAGSCILLDNYYLDHDLPQGIDQLDAYCVLRNEINKKLDITSGFYATVSDNLFVSVPAEVYIEGISAKGRTIREVVNDFALKCNVKFSYGVIVNSSKKLQVVFNAIDTVTPKGIQLETAKSYTLGIEGEVIPAKIIARGTPIYKNNIYNGTFEIGGQSEVNTVFTELGYVMQPSLLNGIYSDVIGGAESGTMPSSPARAISNGASIKVKGADGDTILAREDESVYELDRANELVSFTEATTHVFPVLAGLKYTLSAWAKGEVLIGSATSQNLQVKLEFLNAAGTVLASTTQDWFITDTNYRLVYCKSGFAPATTTRARATFRVSVGTFPLNGGHHIDSIKLHRSGKFYADGWQLTRPSNAANTVIVNDYAFRPLPNASPTVGWKTKRGGGAFAFDVTVPVATNNFITLFTPRKPMGILPGVTQKWIVHLSALDGAVGNFPSTLRVRVMFYRQNGTFISSYISPNISITPPAVGFAEVTNNFDVPINTVYSYFYLDITSTGKGVVDDISVRDVRETSLTYYDDEIVLELNAGTLIPSLPYSQYIARYGDSFVSIAAAGGTVQEVYDYTIAWLNSQITNALNPEIRDDVNSTEDASYDFSKAYRVVELDLSFPLEKVSFQFGVDGTNALEKTTFLQTRPKSLSELTVGIENNSAKFVI